MSALLSAVLAVMLGTGIALTYFLNLPLPSSTASRETVESYAAWKSSLYAPVGVITLVVVPTIVGLARFVSLYPPRPIAFTGSMTIIATVAAVTHWMASPLKGPADILLVLMAIVVCALVMFGLGSCHQTG